MTKETYHTEEVRKLEVVAGIVERKFGKHVAVVLRNTVFLMDTICQQSASLVAHQLLSLDQMASIQAQVNTNLRAIVDVALHKLKPDAQQEVLGLIIGLGNSFADAMKNHMVAEVQAAVAKRNNAEQKAEDGKQG